jgi:hypothetical protein
MRPHHSHRATATPEARTNSETSTSNSASPSTYFVLEAARLFEEAASGTSVFRAADVLED